MVNLINLAIGGSDMNYGPVRIANQETDQSND